MTEVSVGPDGRSAVVTPPDELWLGTTAPFESCVIDLIDAGVRHVVIELDPVSLLCSTGVQVILQCEELLAASGGSLQIRNPHGIVRRVVELTPLRQLVA